MRELCLDVIHCVRTGRTPDGRPLEEQSVSFMAAFRVAQAMDYRMKAGPGLRL